MDNYNNLSEYNNLVGEEAMLLDPPAPTAEKTLQYEEAYGEGGGGGRADVEQLPPQSGEEASLAGAEQNHQIQQLQPVIEESIAAQAEAEEVVVPPVPALEQAEATTPDGEVASAEAGEAPAEAVQENNVENNVAKEGEEEEPAAGTSATPAPPPPRATRSEPKIDPNQCRVCTSKEALVNIFEDRDSIRLCDQIKTICSGIRISERDLLPHFLCAGCIEKVNIACDFKKLCETADRDFRSQLKRSQNKKRTAGDYILLDATKDMSTSDDDEALQPDDDEFRISETEESPDSDETVDSEPQPKRRGRKKKSTASSTPASTKKPQQKSTASTAKKQQSKRVEPSKKFKPNVVYIEAPDSSDSSAERKRKRKRRAAEEAKPPPTPARKPVGFPCSICGLGFSAKPDLKRHMSTIHAPGRKPVGRPPGMGRGRPPASAYGSSASKSYSTKKRDEPTGKDLFKACAPLTTTYWSDSFSD